MLGYTAQSREVFARNDVHGVHAPGAAVTLTPWFSIWKVTAVDLSEVVARQEKVDHWQLLQQGWWPAVLCSEWLGESPGTPHVLLGDDAARGDAARRSAAQQRKRKS